MKQSEKQKALLDEITRGAPARIKTSVDTAAELTHSDPVPEPEFFEKVEDITEKQRDFARAAVAGLSPKDASKFAGYSRPINNYDIKTSQGLRGAFERELAARGINPNSITKGVSDGLLAETTLRLSSNKWEKAPDHKLRLEYIKLALKMLGMDPYDKGTFAQSNTQFNINNNNYKIVIEGGDDEEPKGKGADKAPQKPRKNTK